MPARVTIRAGKSYSFSAPVALIATRGKELAYLAVGTESDGLIDGPEEVLAAAEAWRLEMEAPVRERFDRNPAPVKDISNSCPPSQASG